MTMTLDFDERAVPLTEDETATVLRQIGELRRGLEYGDDVGLLRDQLRTTVQLFIHRHTHVHVDAIRVEIKDDGSRIRTRRVHPPES